MQEIDNFRILIRNSLFAYKYNEQEDMFHGLDVNIAIAASITAYARIFMSYLKKNSNIVLYYSDTDSIVVDTKLPDELVGKAIGQVKLEHIIKRAIFLAPKVYGFEDEDGKVTIKIKGISHDITDGLDLDVLESLLVKDSSKEFKQFKWFKRILEGKITVEEVIYNLKVTANKRMPIYKKVALISSHALASDMMQSKGC